MKTSWQASGWLEWQASGWLEWQSHHSSQTAPTHAWPGQPPPWLPLRRTEALYRGGSFDSLPAFISPLARNAQQPRHTSPACSLATAFGLHKRGDRMVCMVTHLVESKHRHLPPSSPTKVLAHSQRATQSGKSRPAAGKSCEFYFYHSCRPPQESSILKGMPSMQTGLATSQSKPLGPDHLCNKLSQRRKV